MAVCFKPRENFFQVFLQGGADQRIERAERFVEQKQFRRQGEGAHQTDPLTLAAGKLDRKTVERRLGKSGQRAKLREAVVHLRRGPFQMARHEKNVFAGGEMRKKAAILNDVADAATELGEMFAGVIGAPSKLNRSAVWIEQADDQRRRVDFPQPLGPIRTVVCRARNRESVGWSAVGRP